MVNSLLVLAILLGIEKFYQYFYRIIGKDIQEIKDIFKKDNIEITDEVAKEIQDLCDKVVIKNENSISNDLDRPVEIVDFEEFKRIIEEYKTHNQ